MSDQKEPELSDEAWSAGMRRRFYQPEEQRITVYNRRAAAVIPPIICDKPRDLVWVHALPDYRLYAHFHDGVEGIVDMKQLIHTPDAGVFAALADPELFAQVGIEFGGRVVAGRSRPGAPDVMHAQIKAHGHWIP